MATMKPLVLGDETWGERLRRAYRRARDRWGEGFNYRTAAEQISRVYPVSMTALMRLEQHENMPSQGRVRLVGYLALTAYGFDPVDFGLTPENTPLGGYDLRKVRQLLAPSNRKYEPRESAHDPSRRRVA